MAAALREIVYFRDVYRATNNGVPDLVEVIRQIDLEAVNALNRLGAASEAQPRKRIALSFIGHSMGGLVVVSAIRVLSDVFDPEAILTKLSGAARRRTTRQTANGQVSGTIGHVFDLMRFVLASPDIPGETLLANRANFLASSLRRFKEAYLFSSEGDGVLRSISTIVNYFTFPTRSRNYGYRLGNAEILTSDFSKPVAGDVLRLVRVGRKTLADLSTETVEGNPSEVANAFTYFDCTDYKDGEPPMGMLTEARNYKRNDPNARIPLYEHIKLLILYVAEPDRHPRRLFRRRRHAAADLPSRLPRLHRDGRRLRERKVSVERVRAASNSDHAVGAIGRERSASSRENGYFSGEPGCVETA